MKSFMTATSSRSARAFTLVEMLTVVVIIGLLVGLLLPAVNAARNQAKATVSRSTLATLSTGLESFRADQKVGGSYVPSAADETANGIPTYRAVNPRSNSEGDIAGANLLVWGMAGADLLGTPGFRPISEQEFWSKSTGSRFNTDVTQSGLYALYPANDARRAGQPVNTRVAPYVDLGKIAITRYDPNIRLAPGSSGAQGQGLQQGSYIIDLERKAGRSIGRYSDDNTTLFPREFPFFLDGFGQPILYWRADPAGTVIADAIAGRTNNPQTGPPAGQRGIYHFRDNESLLSQDYEGSTGAQIGGGRQKPLLLKPGSNLREPHNLVYEFGRTEVQLGSNNNVQTSAFAAYIRNKAVTAKLDPQNAQSYLLVSAGLDGVFGTGDDITNFEHNGAELKAPQ